MANMIRLQPVHAPMASRERASTASQGDPLSNIVDQDNNYLQLIRNDIYEVDLRPSKAIYPLYIRSDASYSGIYRPQERPR
jgi:hypothetical protein